MKMMISLDNKLNKILLIEEEEEETVLHVLFIGHLIPDILSFLWLLFNYLLK